MNKKNTRKGFTIVELVIVIAVIAILAAVLIPTFGNIIEKANDSALVQEIRNAYTAYAAECADDANYSDDVIIKVDDKFYSYSNGSVVKGDDGKPTEATVNTGDKYWDAATGALATK